MTEGSVLGVNWKDWCWSCNSNTLASWCKELTHLKRPWCWEKLKARGEGDDRGWDGLMASLTQWTWVWVNSTSWWWTGRPGVLWFMGSQRVGHDWVTELNWTEETHVWRLALEDTLEKGMATHSSILAWRTPWTKEPGRLQSIESHRVVHDWSNWVRMHTLKTDCCSRVSCLCRTLC